MTVLSDIPTAAALKVALDTTNAALTALNGSGLITAIVVTPADGGPPTSVPVTPGQTVVDNFKTMLTNRRNSLTTQLAALGVA